MQTISRSEIKDLLQRGGNIALVEALPENFYARGHLPAAICLPPGHVAMLAPQVLPDKKQTVVVYCSSNICQNSLLAAEELTELGYTDVRRYVEGKEDWRKAGLPLETDADDQGAEGWEHPPISV